MSEEEVISLVGRPPLEQANHPPSTVDIGPARWLYEWDFGELRFDSDAFPFSLRFLLLMSDGRVESIEDPFDHVVSRDGLPSTPDLMSPRDGVIFDHYPRILDLRWRPSAGLAPVVYDVETEFENQPGRFILDERVACSIPYYAVLFPGTQKGRWRVRAKNQLGASGWSLYRIFKFI
jgi:hypothetical protein